MGRLKAWRPTKKIKDRAYKLYKKGITQKAIRERLGISLAKWDSNKQIFFEYFASVDLSIAKQKSRERGRGRPKGSVKLTEERRRQFLHCLTNDMTREQAAKIIGVNDKTVYNWYQEFPEFKRQAEIARDKGILDIKGAQHKSAKGMYVTEIVTKEIVNPKTGRVIEKEVQKKRRFIPANTNAQQFILINRARWSHDPTSAGTTNQGDILKALDKETDISDEEMEGFE